MGKNTLLHRIVAIFVFATIAAGAFYLFYFDSKEQGFDPSAYQTKIESEPTKEYEIREKQEGRFLVNERARFMLAIPIGWDVEMIDETGEVKFLSPGVMIDQKNLPPLKGCIIGTTITHFTSPLPNQENIPQNIKKQITGDSPLLEGAQKVVTVNNRMALKTFTERNHGGILFIELPIENTIYHFGVTYSVTDKNKCLEKFNRLIDSVSID